MRSFLLVHKSHQQKAGADGHPADPPEPTRGETKHDLDVVTEAVGTWNTHKHNQHKAPWIRGTSPSLSTCMSQDTQTQSK